MSRPSRTAEYGRHIRRMQAYGRWQPYVDAEPARQHVKALMEAGMGPVTIAKASGVPHGSISKLIYGDYGRGMAPSKRIRQHTAERLLAIVATPDHMQPGCLIPADGTRRRLQALAFMGYPLAWIAARVDTGTAGLWRLQHGRSQQCTVATYKAVRALYHEHATKLHRGPRASVTRKQARANGWESAMAWDVIDATDERAARGYGKSGPRPKEGVA